VVIIDWLKVISVLPLLDGLTTTEQKSHHLALKSVHFGHEIMEIVLF
jgi:hypothetical protein